MTNREHGLIEVYECSDGWWWTDFTLAHDAAEIDRLMGVTVVQSGFGRRTNADRVRQHIQGLNPRDLVVVRYPIDGITPTPPSHGVGNLS